eukprot:2735373-Amphidinium_carterae.1
MSPRIASGKGHFDRLVEVLKDMSAGTSLLETILLANAYFCRERHVLSSAKWTLTLAFADAGH